MKMLGYYLDYSQLEGRTKTIFFENTTLEFPTSS